MKGDEFSSGNGEIERELLRGCERSPAGGFPSLYNGTDFRWQIPEMGGIPAILGYPTVRKRGLRYSRQAEKRDCNRRNESTWIHDYPPKHCVGHR